MLGQEFSNSLSGATLGGISLAVILAFLAIAIILLIALWIYTSFAWANIAKKLKHKNPWLAWIPFARTAMILELGGFSWAWVFLFLIPILGWIAIGVLHIISTWRIFEKRKYPGWLALIPIAMAIPVINWFASIAYLITIGFVAWKKP